MCSEVLSLQGNLDAHIVFFITFYYNGFTANGFSVRCPYSSKTLLIKIFFIIHFLLMGVYHQRGEIKSCMNTVKADISSPHGPAVIRFAF